MKTYHIITIGCQMNISDSERIAGYLNNFGLKNQKDKLKADMVILVTCGVRQSAEDRIYGIIPKIKKANPKCKIILTGCLANREDVRAKMKNLVDFFIPINKIFNFQSRVLGTIFKQFSNFKISKVKKINNCTYDNYLTVKPKYSNNFSAFVPIGNGCNNFCSYCVVPYARGREIYRPAEEIIDEVKQLIKKGYKEIILIAQNVNSYHSKIFNFQSRVLGTIFNEFIDRNKKEIYFYDLLRIINGIKGDFWIRFATSHPKDMNDELIKTVAQCDKVCEHVHLPVQAGDNSVLKRMNRKYTVDHYQKLIKKIRKIIPGAAITTDIIVGFPGENKAQFANTLKLCREVKFDQIYSAQYSPRPGTAALNFKDDVPAEEKKRREKELINILRQTALDNNKKYIGKTVDILVNGKNRKGQWQGRTRTDKVCRINPGNFKIKIGEFVMVKINDARDFELNGKIIKA